MISPTKEELITITLKWTEVEVPNGMNAVEAAALHGHEVPHIIYHPKLSGWELQNVSCRDGYAHETVNRRANFEEDGSPKIGWVPKPVIGCATNVSSGMHLRTESDLVSECREGIMEFLLVNVSPRLSYM